MNDKPGFFARTRDVVIVFLLALLTMFAVRAALADDAKLIDLDYRAYDRVPANADLTKFRSEDYSEKKAAGAIQVMFSETLMPSDDWLFIDGPMSPRVESIRLEHCEDFYLRQFLAPHTEPLFIARLAEIPQEHPWMAEHKGKFRCYVAYLPASASFPDTITVVAGAVARCVPVWRSGKEPRPKSLVEKGALP